MSLKRRAAAAILVLGFASMAAAADSPDAPDVAPIAGARVPKEILALLRETQAAHGSAAVALQLQLLHHAIRSDSLLTAGVRVGGVETIRAHRYLTFFVETGTIFHSARTDPSQRLRRIWSDVVVPAVDRVDGNALPAEGIAVELHYAHRPYGDLDELMSTAADNPGRAEAAALYLLRSDMQAFRHDEIDADELLTRAEPHIDGTPMVLEKPAVP
jgi:hypothetical protein